jgi:large subunit ribosomal protein L22
MKESEKLEAVAFSKYIRMSPFKVRRILDQIRGRSYYDALLILLFMPYKACSVILKVVRSAVANARKKYNISSSLSFIISEARADAGPTLKRFRPHAQGKGFPIKKRMSHIISII